MSIKVTTIPATKPRVSGVAKNPTSIRRVAAYARVSTASEEQATSYEAQVDYYSQLITARPDWRMVKVYTDEGITGTSTKKRAGFQAMVQDAMDGKIDLILTKSVSRFARNTVDSLTTVRQLKEAGVEIFFEKENIWTFDAKGELLITIMSSLAQEESRSISENVKWGIRKRFADGQVVMPYPAVLGFEKGADGRPQVNKEEAVIVRRIYREFLGGAGFNAIAQGLTADGVPSPGYSGKHWYATTIKSILTNEKYRGDARLQKTYISDFLTKKQVKNHGEIPQYYVTGSHEAIIDPDVFDLVQYEIKTRKGRRTRYPMSMKFRCSVCGDWYGPKTWHSNDAYRARVWQCNSKYKPGQQHPSKMPHPTSEELEAKFLEALNTYLSQRHGILSAVQEELAAAQDTSSMEEQLTELAVRIEGLAGMMAKEVEKNSRNAQNQKEYQDRFTKLEAQHAQATQEYQELAERIEDTKGRRLKVEYFMRTALEQDHPITQFSARTWYVLVDHAIIEPEGTITFYFSDGTPIAV